MPCHIIASFFPLEPARSFRHAQRRVPLVTFTSALERHVQCPPMRVDATTLRAALEAYFAAHPRVRAYVLDEQGALRHHVVVFVDGAMAQDRAHLAEPVAPSAEIYVMQALSGG
jgi:hypothetical protein